MNDYNNTTQAVNMGEKPFFSIIIPVYNAGHYLGECLQSISDQDFQDWEAILVDDGSSDDSVAIAESHSKLDNRIKVFRSTSNSGCAYIPRIRAANLAKADYIVTIDADDIVSADLLAIHHRRITSCKTDLVIPEMWRLKGNITEKILPLDSIDTSKEWEGKDLVRRTLCRWEIPMCGFAIRRDIYLNANKRMKGDDLKSIYSDELLSRWLLSMSKNVVFTESRYYYRQNEESVTHINIPRIIDSKMLTCDGLLSMTATVFGENSDTHIRALENKLYAAVDMLRMINLSSLESKQKTVSVKRISSAMKNFDISKLKGKTSPRYLALMRLPIPLARIALKILDPIIMKKNGI
ncbi:MAG: glycosyltransferase [Muribaculaceae bacterium]|nr:glycosyltransferase [Muribaculaceae bacterium]